MSTTTNVTPISPAVADTVKPVALGDARFKAVRRVKNRLKTHINSRINLYTRSIPKTKDPTKVKVLQGKIEALQYTLALIEEV